MSFVKSYKKILLGFFLASLLFIVACARPLPQDKVTYAGYWQGNNVTLTIDKGGRVNYRKKQGYGSTKIKAPIKEFKGNDFIVGIGFVSTTFKVEKPPYEENGTWKMVVDGVELRRLY